MIDYELAKQLKKAGFIQREWKYAFHYIPRKNSLGEQMIGLYDNHKDDGDKLVYIPDLSELIGACGEPFNELLQGKPKGNVWRATATVLDENYSGYDYRTAFCKTPEEAVAKLWLKLKETK